MHQDEIPLDRDDPGFAGAAIYTPIVLRAYDAWVIRLSNTYAWRCPAATMLAHYNELVDTDHLDVGPGTGYYLDHCRFPGERPPRLTLLDANPDALRYAANRIKRYQPTLHTADVLKPITGLRTGAFGSIGLNFVLHCLPGYIISKAVAFDRLIPLLRPDGVIFGSTILNHGVSHNPIGRALLQVYNRRGIFSNLADDLPGLQAVLANRFESFELDVVGSVALFSARKPRTATDQA